MADDARMMREFKMDMVIANPDPLGLFGFAFATFLGNAATLGFYGVTIGQVIFECMFLGGFVQLIAGLQDYKNRNLFGATAFTGFGFFWIVFGVVSWLSYVHLVGPADAATIGWYHLLWAVFVFALVGTSFALTKFLTATVVFVDVGLVLIAVGAFTSIDAATKLGAASLVISAILALYIGLAQMWNITFKRTVLPLYPWKSREPATAGHDQRDPAQLHKVGSNTGG